MSKRSPEDEQAFQIVRKLFKNDYGEPFEMTAGQISIFRAVYEKQSPRVQVECYTQYGKSDVISMAVLLRATTFAERWPIIGGSKAKAQIITDKIIKHIFENDYTLAKFQPDDEESLEAIRQHRAKDRMSFRVDDKGSFGEVFVLSSESRRKGDDAGDILIGHGAPNLIEDDAALIPDPIHGKALRMLGGHKNNFLLKITNSFGRNHAYQSLLDPKYLKIVIDWKQGVAEGRLTQEYVEEMRRVLDPVMFGILYDCVHPPEEMVDDSGWMPLLLEKDIEEAQKRFAIIQSIGKKRLGVDIAEGTNYNAFVIRTDNVARMKKKTLEKDLMKTADEAKNIYREEMCSEMFLDAIGVGAGVHSRLLQMQLPSNGLKAGEKSTIEPTVTQPMEYANQRAEWYWALKNWIQQGAALEPHKDWLTLTKVRYRIGSDKKIVIMPKEEMRVRSLIGHLESTDVPDALAMTFAKTSILTYNMAASEPVKPYYPEIGL